MATADEILEQMKNDPEMYAADPEEICVIDNDLRTITIPSDIQNVGVESDEDVRRLHFQMPKQYHEVDLSEFDIRINFMNANNQGDVYAVTDKQVAGDNITFSWLVGRNALAYRGNIRFVVCLKKVDAEGAVQQEFNTTVAQLTVLEGLETTEAVVAENPDIIEQILARLDDLEENGGDSYTLPIMSDTHLGGGKAVEKTDEDVPVAVDSETGQLFVPTYPESASADIPRQEMQNTDTEVTIEPNKLYVFPEMESLTVTLAEPDNSNVANEYHFFFTSGATATTLTLNDVLSDAYSIEANMKYEVSILEGVAYIKGVSMSET